LQAQINGNIEDAATQDANEFALCRRRKLEMKVTYGSQPVPNPRSTSGWLDSFLNLLLLLVHTNSPCVSTVSIVCRHVKRSNGIKLQATEAPGVMARRALIPQSSARFMSIFGPQQRTHWDLRASTHDADDADGTDGIFGTRAHRDDSCPDPALTRERDLDAQRPKEVRSLQPTTEFHGFWAMLARSRRWGEGLTRFRAPSWGGIGIDERPVLAEWVRQAYSASLRIDSAVADGVDGEKSSREVILMIRFPSRPSR
jgi:hypothetical protein